jgi:peptidoglycan/xylan/chitin deacetylase (PgdA/CDA1 family)
MSIKHKKVYSTIQVDIDGLWVIEKLLGRNVPIDPDPIFTLGLDRLLSLFWEFGVKATFFVVAKDLESPAKVRALKKIVDMGHEIASHGSSHRYLSQLDEKEVMDEISLSKIAIEKALGVKVNGFKAPGFAAHRSMVRILEESGYSYDSSVFGTSCALLMELVSKVSYPTTCMMTASSTPYIPSKTNIFKSGHSSIMEIPVTVAPYLRTPAHFSYMILGGNSYASMIRGLLDASSQKIINYLFHPLDLVDSSEINIDKKVYGLDVDIELKLKMARDMLKFLCRKKDVYTTEKLCEILKTRKGVPVETA